MAQIDKNKPIVESGPVQVTTNVLIIEDHFDTGKIIGAFLTAEGYGARVVESRNEAVAILDTYLYDFIVMDLFMPGLSAEKFIAEVRRRCRSEIILITATEYVAQQAQRLGVHSWVGKPFDPIKLLKILREH
jgi:DNA-binding response OmpR family regulator